MSERTRIVIRHLPAALPEDVFWKTLSPWIEPNHHHNHSNQPIIIYKSYIPGKTRHSKGKVDLPSRAYLQFATVEDLVEFHQTYAQQAFRDGRGNITIPKIEFAPFQKVPSAPKKPDARCGTIESDPDYQAFLRRLESPETNDANGDNGTNGPTDDPSNHQISKITPLIEHLRSLRKAAQDAASVKRHPVPSKSSKPQPPAQIIKRGASSTIPSSTTLPPGTSSSHQPKHPKPTPVPPTSSKPTKPAKEAPSRLSTSTLSNSKPTTDQTQVPKSQSGPSRSKRGQRGGGGGGTGAGDPLHASAADKSSKPVPKTIVTRPKEILTKPKPESSVAGSSNKPGNPQAAPPPVKPAPPQPPHDSQATPSKKGRGGGGRSRATPTSKSSTPASPKPKPSDDSGHNPGRAPKIRGTEEAAGARRRLGMALAGIGGTGTERRSSKKDSGTST